MATAGGARPDPSLRIAVLGGSASAIERVLRALPPQPGLAVITVVVGADQDLRSRLDGLALPVVEPTGTVRLETGTVFIVPAWAAPTIAGSELVVARAPGSHAPFDALLRAAGDVLPRESVGVVLAGPTQAGMLGIKRLKEAGGLTIAQADPDESGAEMPRSAVSTGLVDIVVGIEGIAAKLALITNASSAAAPAPEPEPLSPGVASDTLRDILALVRIRSGHDFSSYKRATLFRRVSRRMQVCGASTLVGYHHYLREHPSELAHLLRDFLISVTSFFRDPDAFESLRTQVIPKLFAGKRAGDPVRVWVAGCATGEEAFSLGILLLEQARVHPEPVQIQIFATDIDDDALAEGRSARYPATIEEDVSPDRLATFFLREGGGYRVTKELRELVLFSPHNVLRDPPFSRLDLVSCRNLLIYLNREAQDRALTVFHFGLRPGGFLVLGSSESAENSALFAGLDLKHRIFTRRSAGSSHGDPVVTGVRWAAPPTAVPPPVHELRPSSAGELHYRLVEKLAPPSVIISEDLEILHVSERASHYLVVPAGEPSRNLLRAVLPPLGIDLRAAVYAARQPGVRTETRIARFTDPSGPRAVEIRVYNGGLSETSERTLLVTFAELGHATDLAPPPAHMPDATAIEPVVRELEDELHRTRDQLRATIEQYETSLEELKASNEELQAINEELRSATEERETSREELQSLNEELTMVNLELKEKIDEVSRANSDLQNLMRSTDLAVIFLDRHLGIQRFTPRTRDLFNVIDSDVGRPFAHLTHRLSVHDLAARAQSVLATLQTVELEAVSDSGRRYQVRLLPYRSLADRIDGVVVTFIDVSAQHEAQTAVVRSEAARLRTEEHLRMALSAATLVLLRFDQHGTQIWGFAGGAELDPRPGRTRLFVDEAEAAVTQAVRDVLTHGAGTRVTVRLDPGGGPRRYELRIERADSGAIAVGTELP